LSRANSTLRNVTYHHEGKTAPDQKQKFAKIMPKQKHNSEQSSRTEGKLGVTTVVLNLYLPDVKIYSLWVSR
jgi:hypothetical protein